MKRLLQIAAVFIVAGFLFLFSGFFFAESAERLFITGGIFASIGAMAAISASIALVIQLLRK